MGIFAERLKTALEIRNISAAELSRKLDIDEGTISNYKKGRYEPKQRRLEEISTVLNVSIPWLMGADVPMDAEKNITTNSTTKKDQELLRLFSRLSESEKQEILVDIALRLSDKNFEDKS